MLRPLGVFLPAEVLLQRNECQPGDVLEINRILYSHWAIYIGDNEVVHLPESADGTTVVERCTLQNVAQDGLVRVNNKQVPAREKELTEFSNEEVVKRAIDSVGTTVPYNIVTSNGEHFVTKLKYGVGWSDQANVMRNSMSSLSQTPASPMELQRVQANLFCEIQNILSSSPPTNSGPISPSLQRFSTMNSGSSSPPILSDNSLPSPPFPLSQSPPPQFPPLECNVHDALVQL